MMPEQKSNIGRKAGAGIILLCALLAVAYLISLFVFKEIAERKRLPPDDILVLNGFPEDGKIEAFLEQRRQASPLLIADNKATLSAEQKEVFGVPYKIKMSLQTPDGRYRDFAWSVSDNGVDYNIVVDGFTSADTIELTLNDNVAVKRMPFDWSGKIELPVLMAPDTDAKVCIDIRQKGATMNVCHAVIGKNTP